MEILKRDAEIAFLKRQLNGGVEKEYDAEYLESIKQINDNMQFIQECNIGGEYMEENCTEQN